MKLLPTLGLFAITGILLTGCTPPQKPEPKPETRRERMEPLDMLTSTGRFQLVTWDEGFILFDTQTADTWVKAAAKTNWFKLPNPLNDEMAH